MYLDTASLELLTIVVLILANAFSIVCNTLLIGMKIYYKEDDNQRGSDYIEANRSHKEET